MQCGKEKQIAFAFVLVLFTGQLLGYFVNTSSKWLLQRRRQKRSTLKAALVRLEVTCQACPLGFEVNDGC